MKIINICLFAPIPPPFHGSSYAAKLFLESEIKNKFNLYHIDAKYASEVSNIGKFRIDKIYKHIKYLYNLFSINRINHLQFVIIIPSFNRLSFLRDSLTILLINKFSNFRIILWCHSNNAELLYTKSNRLLKKIISIVIKKAYHVVTVGDKLQDNFSPFLSKDKMSTIPNGVPVDKKINIKEKGTDIIQILYLSNFFKMKGWKLLLYAANSVCKVRNNVIFKFAGAPGIDSTINEIEESFNKMNFQDRIFYLGSCYGEAKIKLLEQSHIFCLPTLYPIEALPIAILEAMKYKLAIITTNKGAISEAVVNKKGGLVLENLNLEVLVESILYLVDNKNIVYEMAEYNRERYLKNYSLEITTKKWINLLNELHNNSFPQT